ncbi:DHA2 family efflux MFS transporter permease subunit [Caminibacter pacificus]|uniref:DHA2 family efflux MFS transporter permease subunit n=1 Tax=Caminibacter pacificus TaxID=1424653 RepID=A0AAJ4UXC4_9BACT|nr:DHA2 family efflux MFS transporter permease subunit [Caminibacter pacificus]QCI29014.1 DHA2 family efflux MFS transporter permease subunit [Caminibacter pacificus]ROR39177.1 DHA2 family multidrug resistance protein [Caminibacter pacificus]
MQAKKTFSIIHFTLLIILVVLGAFMAVLDTTVVDIIVPRLKGPLSTDIYGVQWVITAYMIAAAVGLLVVEWLIKHYGNKIIYVIGVAAFTLASFGCGMSHTLPEIIIFRTIQGFAEALVMVTAQAMLFSFFPPEKRGIAMGIFALGVAFAPAIGPTLGGYLTEWFSWRAVFFVNVPIGIVLVVFSALLLPDNSKRSPYPLNFVSLTFLTVFTVSLLILLSKGQQYGWFNSPFIVYLAFASWFGLLGFIISEYFSKNSLFDYSLFKNPYYSIGIMVYFILLGFSMYQYFYLIPMYYEHLKGLSSIQTGLGVLGFGIWIGVFSIIAGALSDKFSPIPVLIAAAVIYLYSGYVLFPSLNYYTPFYEAVLKTMPFGIAMGLFFAPITVLVMNNSNGKIEQGIMTMDYVRFIGGSFGTAIATNNLVFYKDKEFDAMVSLQNHEVVSSFLAKMEQIYGIVAKVIFRMFEDFMSFNYGFKYVWLDAAFWGAVGSFFIFMLLFVKRRKYEKS